jgi:hypothetical protein
LKAREKTGSKKSLWNIHGEMKDSIKKELQIHRAREYGFDPRCGVFAQGTNCGAQKQPLLGSEHTWQ